MFLEHNISMIDESLLLSFCHFVFFSYNISMISLKLHALFALKQCFFCYRTIFFVIQPHFLLYLLLVIPLKANITKRGITNIKTN